MTVAENVRNLVPLCAAIKPTHLARLLSYSVSNRLSRATGIGLHKEVIMEFSFGAFRVVPECGDLGTIGEIFVNKPYLAYPDFIPRNGDTCLDVGANIGCVSSQWRLTNKTGLIVAVEPHPVTFERMMANFALNRIEAVESVQAAIGSANRRIDIIVDERNNSMARVDGPHLSAIRAFNRSNKLSATCVTIDALCAEKRIGRLNLLKIDVEGYEVEALRGATHSLQFTNRVVLEYHSAELGRTCTGMLAASGFECFTRKNILFGRKRSASGNDVLADVPV